MGDSRAEPRWVDVRTASARSGTDEYLGQVRELSPGGMQLVLVGGTLRAGDASRISVVFERGVTELHGRVVYAFPEPWGSLMGIRCDAGNQTARGFLNRRYDSL